MYRYRVKHCTYYLMQDQNEISHWPSPVLAEGHYWHPIEPTTIGYFHNIIFSNPVLNCFALTHWSKWIYSLALVFEFKYVVCDGFFHIFTHFFNVSLRLEAQAFQAIFDFCSCRNHGKKADHIEQQGKTRIIVLSGCTSLALIIFYHFVSSHLIFWRNC